MDPILNLPLHAIAMDALPRDRSALDPDALDALQASIARDGQRQPIEVWQLGTPTAQGHTHGLISGLRRLTVHHTLHRLRPTAFGTIHAILRQPASIAAAMAAMVAENEIRAELSAWDKGRVLVQSVDQGLFDCIETATNHLHPTATRQKRSLLRSFAHVVDALDGALTDPHTLSSNRMLQLASALRGGMTPLIDQILRETRGQSPDRQWHALQPTLTEAAQNLPETPATPHTPGRPRRLLNLRQGLTIRRELSNDGWKLCFSGPEARKGALMDDVMDHVERLFQQYT